MVCIGNFDGVINEEPSEKQPPKQTTIKSGCEHLFKTPINSTLAIFPLHFWEIIKVEVNRHAEQKLRNKQGKKLIAGYKWKPVTLSNIMTYFGILIYGMLSPNRADVEGLMGLSLPKFMDQVYE
jgi:hypothetical protein